MLLSQMEYFRVVAHYEHITKAAEELHIAQPSLSATINRLEKELGVPLFDRNGRNIMLNDAGRKLLANIEFIQTQLEEMEATLKLTKETLENTFILSVSNSGFLTGWLQQFVLQNPTIRLQQKMLSEKQMLEALLDESIDVALGLFENIPDEITCKTLVEDEYVITFSAEHPLAQKEIVYFEDIRDAEIITLPSNTISKIADRVFVQKNCEPNIVFEGNAYLMLQYKNENRNGISFATKQMLYMPYFYGKQKKSTNEMNQNQYNFLVRTVADIDCNCNLSICWKKGRTLSLGAQKFINSLEQEYPIYHQDELFLQDRKIVFRVN